MGTQSAYPQATSAVTWPDLILGALTCNGTGRRLPLSKSGPEVTMRPGVLFWYQLSARSADSVSLPTDALPAVAGLRDSSSFFRNMRDVKVSGAANCTALLLLISLCRDELWLWSITDLLTPAFWLCVKFFCVKSSNNIWENITEDVETIPCGTSVHMGSACTSQPVDFCTVTHSSLLGERLSWLIFYTSWCWYKYNLSFWCVRSKLLVSSNVSSNAFGSLPSGTWGQIHFLLGEPSFDCRFPSCSFIGMVSLQVIPSPWWLVFILSCH